MWPWTFNHLNLRHEILVKSEFDVSCRGFVHLASGNGMKKVMPEMGQATVLRIMCVGKNTGKSSSQLRHLKNFFHVKMAGST